MPGVRYFGWSEVPVRERPEKGLHNAGSRGQGLRGPLRMERFQGLATADESTVKQNTENTENQITTFCMPTDRLNRLSTVTCWHPRDRLFVTWSRQRGCTVRHCAASLSFAAAPHCLD